MRDDQHIVCFGQCADLLAGGDAAYSADVRADILAGMACHQHLELPQVDGALAGGDGYAHLAGDFGHGIHVVGRHGILKDHRAVRLDGTAKRDRFRQSHAAVDFQHEVEVRADGLTADAHLLHFPLDPAGVEFALSVRGTGGSVAEDLRGRKAHLLQLLILFHQLLTVFGDVHDRSVDTHLIAGLAAQQLVDRHTQSLALDVPQCDVDGRDRAHDDRAAEINRPQEILVEVLDAEGVFANEVIRKFFDGSCRRLQIAPVAGLAQTHDSGIGVDLYEEIVLRKAQLHVRNFHSAFSPVTLLYYRCSRKNLQ